MTGRPDEPPAPALVLMTATIQPPPGVPALVRTDPVERLEDYRRALGFYASLPSEAVDRIVLAENSGADLAALEGVATAAGKRVELVGFDGLDYPVAHGRAVGEVRLIATALERSRLLGSLGEGERFWKVTGRLRVTNLARLAGTVPAGVDLYADFRRIPRPWVDLRAFACTRRGFRDFLLANVELMRQDELDAAGYSAPEERLFEQLAGELGGGRIAPRLRLEPRLEGYSGFGDDYGRPSRRAWTAVRSVVRRLAPGVWI